MTTTKYEAVVEFDPHVHRECSSRVIDGASMIRGLPNYRNCHNTTVFVVKETGPDGKVRFNRYCRRHANADAVFLKTLGYVSPSDTQSKMDYVAYYTLPDGRRAWAFLYSVKNERGARMSFSRLLPGVVPDQIVVRPPGTAMNEKGELVDRKTLT